MQRFFSAFPSGWPGLGLLLLRGVVGGVALAQGVAHLAAVEHAVPFAAIRGLLPVASGALMLIGFATPVTSLALLLSIWLFWLPAPIEGLFLTKVSGLFMTLNSAAVALLGPGAMSLDAWLFGRREIIIPADPRSPRS